MIKYSSKRYWIAAAITVVLAVLLIGASLQDYFRVRNTSYQLAEREAFGLLQLIELALEQADLSERSVLSAVHDHLFSVAYRVVNEEEQTSLTSERLTTIALESGIASIQVINQRENLILCSAGHEISIPAHLFQDNVTTGEQVVGFLQDHSGHVRYYAVAVENRQGNWILVALDADEILALRNEIGLGAILDELGQSPNFRYAALIASGVVIAATADPPEWLEGLDDPGFRAGGSETTEQGFVSTPEGLIFEICTPAQGYNNVYLRLGIRSDELAEIRRKSLQTVLIRSILFILLTAVTTAMLLAIFRNQVLAAERDAIREEVHRLEEEKRRSERLTAMGELAAGVAHEIRNPLNAVSMAVQRLDSEFQTSADKSDFSALVKALKEETNRIERIIEDFLRFARPPKINKTKQNIKDTIEPLFTIFTPQADSKNVQFMSSIQEIPPFFYDADQLNQAVLNLLRNALEAVPDANGKIQLEVFDQNHEVCIRVSDNGSGIPENMRDRIFDLYYTTRENGSGLGLPHVQQIVADHGGTVQVMNGEDGGALFEIRLPGVSS